MHKKKIIIQFNEANFDLIEKYCKKYDLSHLSKIINFPTKLITSSEDEYSNLEPWIQWYSFYTGLSYKEHKTFHLGDCLKSNHDNFVENMSKEYDIGIFGSMNLRPSQRYKIFIPDPWTEAYSDKSISSYYVNLAIKVLVNSNARLKLSYKSILGLIILIGFPKNLKKVNIIIKILFSYINKSRSHLASYFDYLYFSYALKRINNNNINFALIFLNGLAHIQHHYFLSSENVKSNNPSWYDNGEDQILKSLNIYNDLFKKLEVLDDAEIWVVTGLTQEPQEKPIIYWRFKNHMNILKEFLNLNLKVFTRMTRDFEIEYYNEEDSAILKNFLENSYLIDENNLQYKAFTNIDFSKKNRVFVTFAYDGENENIILNWNKLKTPLKGKLDFVAIKNGKHNGSGWAFCNVNKENIPKSTSIWNLNKYIY